MCSVKEPVPFDLRSRVVYKFLCAGCNACYIGETSQHLSTRVREHLSWDRNSHVYQHLQQSQACRCLANKNCFSIVDYAPNRLQLMLKEAMHIKWENPTLNKQLKHADLTLSFWYYSLSLLYIYVYIYIFVLITFCVITIVIVSIFIIFFLVVLAQVIFHVSRILKLYVNFSKFWFVSRFNLYVIACISSTELTNEFTTEADRWTIKTCLVLNLKLLSVS